MKVMRAMDRAIDRVTGVNLNLGMRENIRARRIRLRSLRAQFISRHC